MWKVGGLVATHARRRVASSTASWLRWSGGVAGGSAHDSSTSHEQHGTADGRGRQQGKQRSPAHRANSPVRHARTAASMPKYDEGWEEKERDPPAPGERVKALRRQLRDEAIAGRSGPLEDTFGRRHNYLRISLTEKCNLRCLYCMPEEGIDLTAKEELLSADEVVRVARLFVANGVDKIRLTGGEPTVRPDLEDIIRRLRALTGLRDIAITTNGLTLHRNLDALQAAGLTHVNISLDTLVPPKFELLTRRRGHDRVLKSIDRAVELGYDPVKVNVVLMRGVNDDELLDFVEMTREKPINVRFIEFMPFDGNKFEEKKVVSYCEAKERILEKYPSLTMGYAAGRAGGTMTGVFSAANEQAVAMFLDKKIGYFDIYTTIEKAMEAHKNDLILDPTLDDIVACDLWARDHVKDLVESGMCKELVAA